MCAAKAARTSPFSRFGTLAKSKVRSEFRCGVAAFPSLEIFRFEDDRQAVVRLCDKRIGRGDDHSARFQRLVVFRVAPFVPQPRNRNHLTVAAREIAALFS